MNRTAGDDGSAAPTATEKSGAPHPLDVRPLCRPLRIVLTGGPGGGKKTAADPFRREIGDRVVIVPESATILFAGGSLARPNQQYIGPCSGPAEALGAVRSIDCGYRT